MPGSVRKYGPTWRIRWDAGARPDGRRIQRSKGGFTNRKDAEKELQKRIEAVQQGHVLDASKMTLGSYLSLWLESKRSIRASTHRSYEGHIRVYLQPHLGNIPLTALRADHLDEMYAAIRAGGDRKPPSTPTIRRVHATLRTALNGAVKRRLIPYNPALQVEMDPEPLHERDIWTPTELAAFLTYTAGDRLAAAYHLIAFTGLRRGECCGLRWTDLDLESQEVTIRRQLTQSGKARDFGEPKTRRGVRLLALDSATIAVLRGHRAAQAAERLAWGPAYNDQGLVFCKEDGSPIAPEKVSSHFLTLTAKAGLPRIVLHGLRHTHATHALAAGVDVTVVSKRLGHSRSSFTADTYMRLLPAVNREAAELVAAMVRQAGQIIAAEQAP